MMTAPPLPPLQAEQSGPSQHRFYHDTNDGYLVLSVDDDPINQMVVENLLSTEGYQVRNIHTLEVLLCIQFTG